MEHEQPPAGSDDVPDSKGRRPTHPWVFLPGMVPVGATQGHVVALAYLLEVKNHVSVQDIAALSALTFIPHSWKFVWTPVLDTWIRRRSWYLWTSLLASLGTLAAFCVPGSRLALLSVLLFLVNVASATSNSALGALCATTVRAEHKGIASGYFSTGSLASTGLITGLILALATPPAFLSRFLHPVPLPLIGVLVAAIMLVSSLSVLLIDEALPRRQPIWPMLKTVFSDTLATVRSRTGWTGMLICLSPVGTAALSNVFGALAPDFHATSGDVILATGLVFGLSNSLGAIVGGYLADRLNRRLTYLVSGVLTAACGFAMALSPATRFTYLFWTLAYGIASGLAYAAFYAFVFEMIEDSAGATTKFGLFIGTSNLAISYVTYLDGVMYKHGGRLGISGAASLLCCDGVLNLLGVAVIGTMLFLLRERHRRVMVATQLAGA